MKDLKTILENVDDICEKFEMEGLHTHPTYKQFKRLFTALNKIAEPVQLISYATDMSTCTLTNGDGTGYFYDRVDPDQPAQYTAVDMANAARDERNGIADSLIERLAIAYPDSDALMTVECFADWLSKEMKS